MQRIFAHIRHKASLIAATGAMAFAFNASAQHTPAPYDSASMHKAAQYAATITASDLRKHLSEIASDAYEGRMTGEKGQKMAAAYLSGHYKSIGLSGPVTTDQPYFQAFNLEKTTHSSGQHILTRQKKRLNTRADFLLYNNFEMPDGQSIELVFAGHGVENERYSDYAGVDVRGKAVLVLDGEPQDAQGKYLLSGTEKASTSLVGRIQKTRLAREKGAKAIFLVSRSDDDFRSLSGYFGRRGSALAFPPKQQDDSPVGVFLIPPARMTDFLGTTPQKMKKMQESLAKKGQKLNGALRNTLQIKAGIERQLVETENVLAFLEGTDLKDEVLVVTSHYDHIGITNGEINNGADDDGSGTVGVMEVAEAFALAAADGHRPRRSILFMNVTGEEVGLLGSQYYAENPVFPLENTIANLNIDMIGRIDPDKASQPQYVYLIGADMLSSELHLWSEETAKRFVPDLELDYKFNAENDPNRFYYRSDHYNFAKNGVPVIFYFNGTHEDYHKPTDDVEKIEFELMAKRAQLVFYTAWQLANRPTRPVVDKAKK